MQIYVIVIESNRRGYFQQAIKHEAIKIISQDMFKLTDPAVPVLLTGASNVIDCIIIKCLTNKPRIHMQLDFS